MVDVSIAASPTLLIEEENTATTLTIELNDPPPADGLIVPFDISIDSGRSKPLAQFDLNNINFEGAELLEGPDLDTLNEFALVVQAQTARLTLPVNNDRFEEGVEEVTFQVRDTADFDITPDREDVTFTIADNAAIAPEPPQFVGAPFTFEIVDPLEAQDGDEVGTVEVENLEGVSFQFTEGNVDADEDGISAFGINDEGVITIEDVDDLESNFQLAAKATNEFGSNEANVVIPFTTVDSFPVITPPDAPITITEDFQVGDEVFTVEANDPDGDNAALTFAINSGNVDVDGDGEATFAINDEGIVTVQDAENLKAGNIFIFNLDVVATDEEGLESNPVTFEVEVTGNVISSNNVPQVQNTIFRIEEDLTDSEVVGTVDISDSDDSLENLEISISAGNNDVDGNGLLPFAINEQGEVTVNDSGDLAAEVGSTFSFTVEAVDPSGARKFGSITVVENDPNVAQPPSVTTNVNADEGTFQASAVDPDGETEDFEFALEGDLDIDGDGEDVFTISDEGEITANDTDNLDFEQQETFTFNVIATEVGVADPLTGQTEVTAVIGEVQEEEQSSDFNNDGLVNLDDLDLFASAFGSQQGEDNFNPIADLTGDGLINLDDLGVFASEFGSELG